ncbi:MAG: methionyl-tRNA formyltransferase [Alphaproteobacteria bacterium]|nr:methionyl-tRNA formyltransferase [Alphaproteobacteria bacterium]
MPGEIILLTGEREGPHLAEHLRLHSPELNVRHVSTREALDAAFVVPGAGRRLISFTTNIIVPGRYIAACEFGAYNFHPGPPSYPGVYPESFAVWEKAARFGATAHEMAKKVDSGPIVATEWFDISPEWGRMHVATLAFQALVRIFQALAPRLACDDTRLAPSGERWTGPTRYRAEFEKMCSVTPDISAADFRRRYRAFGEGPFKDFNVTLHGYKFVVESPWTDADLVREMGLAPPRSDG